jgi:adenylate cyclase
LNDYLTPMADLVLARDGFLTKFAGDGIMAVWGVPDKQPDHATQACLCALEQQAKIDEIRLYFHNTYSVELKVRMGLNSGIVSAGMMGSGARNDYTVMGDAVNLAARLEPAAKDYGIRTLIGQNTYELAKAEIVARPMDRLVVTGKTEPVQIYELMAARASAKPEQLRLAETFSHAIHLYWKREWEAAMKGFEEVLREFPKDSPSFVFVQRIQEYMSKPPPDSWKGEYVRASKH